jgi:type I restriction enzyme S subunit
VSKLYEVIEKPMSGEWGREDEEGRGIPVLRTTNFTNEGYIDYSNVVTRIIDPKKAKEKFLRKGDIIIEKSGGSPTQPVGRVVFFEGEEGKYLFNNFTSMFRLKDTKTSFPKFLFYYLFLNYKLGSTRKYQNKTTGISNLKLDSFIKETEINLPPLETQKYIAKILDTTAELLALHKQQLKELDNLTKSVFYDMFGDPVTNEKGWEVKKLGDVGELKSGGTPSRSNPKFFKGEIPWITTVALGKTFIDESDAVEFITEEAINNSATKLIKENSLLFGTRVGVGKISINKVPMCTNQDIVAIVNVRVDLLNKVYLLKIIHAYSDYFNMHKRGATIQGIKSETLNSINIPLPLLTLQNQFAAIVTKIEEQKALVQKAIDETEYLFDSLMSGFF